MKKRDAAIARSGNNRRALLIAIAALGVLACSCAAEPPREVALGTDVEIGPYALRILRARSAPNPPPPISTFRHQPGKKGIVVFIDWRKLDDDMDAMRRLAFIDSFLENHVSIADAEDKRTELSGSMQTRLMYMEDPGPNWRDWVIVFHVPEASRELRLLIENPEPREGQARLTAVPLGM
jgi:hypothetical protein